MNLVLFAPDELGCPLPRRDRRAVHVLEVLRRNVGDAFDAGVINGPRGKAVVLAIADDALHLKFDLDVPVLPRECITLIAGLPRPQTARDILRDATTLGIAELHFARTAKGERSYAQSTLWSSGEWHRHVVAGAEQSFTTRLPEVTHGRPLEEILAGLPAGAERLALDNYEGAQALSERPLPRGANVVLAIGAERGWSADERALLQAHHFSLVHLGSRVLRTETACIASLAIVRAKLGFM